MNRYKCSFPSRPRAKEKKIHTLTHFMDTLIWNVTG